MSEQAAELVPGSAIIWRHELRGGYGYTEDIPGILRAVRGDRAQVEVRKRDGAAVLRWVKLANVRARG